MILLKKFAVTTTNILIRQSATFVGVDAISETGQ